MARINLRAALMSGWDSPVAAQQVFTNRVDEVAAFAHAIEQHRAWFDDCEVSPVLDRSKGRRNLLSFYGLGGIGKTTLSQELERRLLEGMVFGDGGEPVAIRIDLGDPGATDLESFLLRLRSGLGHLGRRWAAFDIALACYWERAHPGEPLREFLDASPLVRRAARSVGLEDQISENLNLVSPVELGGLTGLAQKAALGVYRVVRERIREGRVLADCDLFSDLVEADADYESLSYFSYLLAWDLERLQLRRRPLVVVFLDTLETIAGQSDRRMERFINRVVYLMPNVLFVATGRNRLQWGDAADQGELDYVGEARWPNLHFSNDTQEPRQHLVGYLSNDDSDSYLQSALVKDGRPAIPASIRDRIIKGGQGLPLYLDLSVSHFVERLSQGAEPAVDDFGGTFVSVATRALRDLPREERDLVRTASLLDRFDDDLLRSGLPTTTHGSVTRFLRRPFLLHDDDYSLPYTLHLALRSAIEEADQTLSDGWSVRDRNDVAQRLLVALGERGGAHADRSSSAVSLEAGLRLACDQGVFDDWLVAAVQRSIEDGQWMAISEWIDERPDQIQPLRTLRLVVDGVVLRRTGHPSVAIGRLTQAQSLAHGDGAIARLTDVHLAHALRNSGDYQGAAAIYERLLYGDFDRVARYWLCDHLFLGGRFREAIESLENTQTSSAAVEGERLRLFGHILRVNARFDEAADAYGRALDLAQASALVAAEAKALTNLAQTVCWSGDLSTVGAMAQDARDILDLLPNPVELVKLRGAEAVALAIAGDVATAGEAVTDTHRLADEIGYRGGHNLADVAGILVARRSGDRVAGRDILDVLDDRTRDSGGNGYWVPIAQAWIDGVERACVDDRRPEVEWLDGHRTTLERWVEVLP